MNTPTIIRLSATELMLAAYIGSARNVQSTLRGWSPGHGVGSDNSWTLNIEGAAGEMAVAKALDLYWAPLVGDPLADDVGPYQVRTNGSRKHDDLALHPKDRDDRAFISVLSFMPEFRIVGWIWGCDGKRDIYWREGAPGRPCFFVPRSKLHPMAELPSLSVAAA